MTPYHKPFPTRQHKLRHPPSSILHPPSSILHPPQFIRATLLPLLIALLSACGSAQSVQPATPSSAAVSVRPTESVASPTSAAPAVAPPSATVAPAPAATVQPQ